MVHLTPAVEIVVRNVHGVYVYKYVHFHSHNTGDHMYTCGNTGIHTQNYVHTSGPTEHSEQAADFLLTVYPTVTRPEVLLTIQ